MARLFLRLAIESLAAAALFGIVVVWPPIRPPAHADVVVVLSGDGARLPQGLRLMERGVASTLVFVGRPDILAVVDLCSEPQRFEVICMRPTPDSTRTEAQSTARLAKSRHWKTMVVVTSRFHAARTHLLFRRCFAGQVSVVGGYPRYGAAFARRAVVHEWLGLVQATLLRRQC